MSLLVDSWETFLNGPDRSSRSEYEAAAKSLEQEVRQIGEAYGWKFRGNNEVAVLAEDLIQEVFISLLERPFPNLLASLPMDQNVRSYLRKMVRNRFIDRYRKAQRFQKVSLEPARFEEVENILEERSVSETNGEELGAEIETSVLFRGKEDRSCWEEHCYQYLREEIIDLAYRPRQREVARISVRQMVEIHFENVTLEELVDQEITVECEEEKVRIRNRLLQAHSRTRKKLMRVIEELKEGPSCGLSEFDLRILSRGLENLWSRQSDKGKR